MKEALINVFEARIISDVVLFLTEFHGMLVLSFQNSCIQYDAADQMSTATVEIPSLNGYMYHSFILVKST